MPYSTRGNLKKILKNLKESSRNQVGTQSQKKLKSKWEQKKLQGQYLKRVNASEINKKKARTFGYIWH